MINTEGLVTTIKCGKNGSATISVGGRYVPSFIFSWGLYL